MKQFYMVPIIQGVIQADYRCIRKSTLTIDQTLAVIEVEDYPSPDSSWVELDEVAFKSYFPEEVSSLLPPTTDEKLDLLGQAIANLELQVALLSGGGA